MVSTGWLKIGIPLLTEVIHHQLSFNASLLTLLASVRSSIHPAAPLFSLCPPSFPPSSVHPLPSLPSASAPLPPSPIVLVRSLFLPLSLFLSASIQPYSPSSLRCCWQPELHLLLLSPLLQRPAASALPRRPPHASAPPPPSSSSSSRRLWSRRRRRLPLITTIDLLGGRSRVSGGAREAPPADCDCSLSLLAQWARALVEFAAAIGPSPHSLEAASLAPRRPQWPTRQSVRRTDGMTAAAAATGE